MNKIRVLAKSDLNAIKAVLNSIELFPADMLEDMTADYFSNPESEDIWFTQIQDETPIAIGFCAPEKLTEGTYNLYAIGVRNDLQGKGIGAAMMNWIEQHLIEKQARVLIVYTSGTPEFELTRKFYEKIGYTKEATIRDFWSEGDDKVVFWKKL